MSSPEARPTFSAGANAPRSPPSTNKALQAIAPNTFEQIEAIIAPFRQILNLVLETGELQGISHFTYNDSFPNESSLAGIPVHSVHTEVHDDGSPKWCRGEEVFPPNTPPEVKMAIFKNNMCDFSVATFFPHIANALRNINARVDWIAVRAKPRFIMHYAGEPFNQPAHSIFGITSSQGDQFIADFSIEQFGHEENCWFSLRSTYVENFTINGTSRLTTDQEKKGLIDEMEGSGFLGKLSRGVSVICAELDWEAYHALPGQHRASWIQARVREIIQRHNITI